MRETNWVRRERRGDRENKPSAVETLEEIAERIPRDWIDEARNGVAMSCVLLEQDKALLVNAIVEALRNERERCARIVNDARGENYDLRSLVNAIREGR